MVPAMRVLPLALLVIAGCNFHIEGTAPPGTFGAPSDPQSPAPATPDAATTATVPDPGTTNGPGTPTPPSTMPGDMVTTATRDMIPAPTVNVGDACNGDADCKEADLKCFKSLGAGLTKLNLPGGYCSKACDSKTPCPTGSECVSTLYGAFCMRKCGDGSNSGCRAGYACCDSVNACGLANFCGGN